MNIAGQDFALDVSFNSDSFEQSPNSDVVGTVVDIPSHSFALVDVPSIGPVMCFRSSFSMTCRNLLEVLKIGDSLAMQMRLGRNNQWLVLSASHVPDKEVRKPVKEEVIKEEVIKKEVIKEEVIKEEVIKDLAPYESKPGERVPLSKSTVNFRYLLNWPGFMTIVPETGIARVRVQHAFGYSILDVDDAAVSMLSNNKLDCAVLRKHLNRCVRFNAVAGKLSFKIEKLWLEKEWPSESLLSPRLGSHQALTRPSTWYCGKITSTPFHDAAIASVGELPVFVPIESFVTEDVTNSKWLAVGEFVANGTTVAMEIKESCEGHFRAERCMGIGVVKVEDVEHEPHLSKWGPEGSCTKEGVLDRKGTAMFVVVEGASLPIGKDKIFVDGKLATESQLNISIGRKLTCFCLHGKRAVCAWFGEFEPAMLLKDKLAVPKGIVHPDKYYDAVVDEFPVPGYAICRIGVLPVLMRTTEKRGFKRGDVVAVCVEEKDVNGVCCLVSKFVKSCADRSLLLNFKGRVVEVGISNIITADENFDVYFDWSAVRSLGSKLHRRDDVCGWFKSVRETVKFGTRVQFSAKIRDEDGSFSGPYDAVEVCVDDEP